MMHVSTVSPALRGSLRDRILRALRRYWPLYLGWLSPWHAVIRIIYKISPIFGRSNVFKKLPPSKRASGQPLGAAVVSTLQK